MRLIVASRLFTKRSQPAATFGTVAALRCIRLAPIVTSMDLTEAAKLSLHALFGGQVP